MCLVCLYYAIILMYFSLCPVIATRIFSLAGSHVTVVQLFGAVIAGCSLVNLTGVLGTHQQLTATE